MSEERKWRTYNMIPNNVMIALFGKELHRKATDISHGIGAAFLATSGTAAEKHWSFLAYSIEEFSSGKVGNVVGNFELTPGAGGFSMHDSVIARPLVRTHTHTKQRE